jgi:hypothetical protein
MQISLHYLTFLGVEYLAYTLEISVTALLWGARVLRVPFSLLMSCGTALR